MNNNTKVTASSGNVFADLGLPNPEEHRVKATLALSIAEKIEERGLTQAEAAKVLGLSQPGISNLVRGKLEKYTIDRLMRYMRKLDYDVTISFKPKPKARENAIIRVENVHGPV
jgi:predicted XRE-type DNA-binding protein